MFCLSVLSQSWEAASLGNHAHKCISNFPKILLGSFSYWVKINTSPLLCIGSFLGSSILLVITTHTILNLTFPSLQLALS